MVICLLIAIGIASVWAGVMHLIDSCRFVKRLEQFHTDKLRNMGISDPWDLLVNIPPNWPLQWKFHGFVKQGGLLGWNDPELLRLAERRRFLRIGLICLLVVWMVAVFAQ